MNKLDTDDRLTLLNSKKISIFQLITSQNEFMKLTHRLRIFLKLFKKYQISYHRQIKLDKFVVLYTKEHKILGKKNF